MTSSDFFFSSSSFSSSFLLFSSLLLPRLVCRTDDDEPRHPWLLHLLFSPSFIFPSSCYGNSICWWERRKPHIYLVQPVRDFPSVLIYFFKSSIGGDYFPIYLSRGEGRSLCFCGLDFFSICASCIFPWLTVSGFFYRRGIQMRQSSLCKFSVH